MGKTYDIDQHPIWSLEEQKFDNFGGSCEDFDGYDIEAWWLVHSINILIDD